MNDVRTSLDDVGHNAQIKGLTECVKTFDASVV